MSQEPWSLLLAGTIDPVIVMDHQGRIVEFNEPASTLLGHTREEAIGTDLAQLIIPAELRDAHRRGLAKYLETGEGPVLGRRIEVAAQARDGELPVELGIVALGHEGRPYFVAHLRDLRPQHQADAKAQALQQIPLIATTTNAREAVRRGLEQICTYANWPLGHAWFVDRQQDRLVSSGTWHVQGDWGPFRQATQGITLARGEGAPGRAWHDGTPVWWPRQSKNFIRAEAAEAVGLRSGLFLPVSLAGETLAVLEFFSPDAMEPAPALLDVLGALQTQLSLALERDRQTIDDLARMRASWLEAQELAQLGSWEFDTASGQVAWSAQTWRIFGLDPLHEVLSYETYKARVQADDWPEVESGIQAALASGEPYELDHRVVRPDGAQIIVHSRGKPRVEDGRVVGLVGTVQDVTQQRMAEGARAETAVLRQLNEDRARFINVAAHELKSPLTPLRLQTEILKRSLKGLTPSQQASLDTLLRSVHRISELVDDVLDAARLQATQLTLHRQPVDLDAVLQEAVASYKAVAQNLHVRLDVEGRPGSVVDADPRRLLQVIGNLLSNALKFTPEGGRVNASVRQEGEWFVLSVTDTGTGLEPKQIERLFQPFSQVHEELATVKGTGLGLYISKGIVEQHEGRLDVSSRGRGKGTTFTVRLPATSQAPQPAFEPRPTASIRRRLRELI